MTIEHRHQLDGLQHSGAPVAHVLSEVRAATVAGAVARGASTILT